MGNLIFFKSYKFNLPLAGIIYISLKHPPTLMYLYNWKTWIERIQHVLQNVSALMYISIKHIVIPDQPKWTSSTISKYKTFTVGVYWKSYTLLYELFMPAIVDLEFGALHSPWRLLTQIHASLASKHSTFKIEFSIQHCIWYFSSSYTIYMCPYFLKFASHYILVFWFFHFLLRADNFWSHTWFVLFHEVTVHGDNTILLARCWP